MPETATFDHYEVLTRDDGSLYELGRGRDGHHLQGVRHESAHPGRAEGHQRRPI